MGNTTNTNSTQTINQNDESNENNQNENENNQQHISIGSKSTSNMFRKDTKTPWTDEQLLKYQVELQKELQRQTNLNSQSQSSVQSSLQTMDYNHNDDNNNNNNIFTCCLKKGSKQRRNRHQNKQHQQHQNQEYNQKEEKTMNDNDNNNNNNIKIAMVPDIEDDDDDGDNSSDTSIDDRLVKKTKKINKTNGDDLNLAVIDTTNAFLELLQLDTMSKHLQEMRDRKMFLEKAKNDKDLPEEEREIAAWITNTFLTKSPTTNYTQTILENIILKKQQEDNDKKEEEKEDKKEIKEEEEEEIKIKVLNKSELSSIISLVDNKLLNGTNSERVISLLSTINDWNFSVFEFVEICNNLSLSLLMLTICHSIHNNIIERLSIPIKILINYMNLVDINYLNNPYHNHIHAADVLLNMYYFMKSSIFLNNISILDCFSILISASIHDIGHPGHNNLFEINTESQLAIIYNDQSVLENMHISLAWKLLKKQDSNILVNLTKNEKKRFRKVLIDSVLATDMSQHSLHSETLEKLVEKYGDNNNKNIDLIKSNKIENEKFSNQFLPISLHTADLGNLCKEIKFYNEWVDRLMNEFFNQGDKERKLGIKPISFLCDRFKVNIHSGQVGFINFVIRPWFNKFGRLLYEDTHNKLFLNLLNENLKYMQERANQTKDAQEEIEKNIIIPPTTTTAITTTNVNEEIIDDEDYDKVPPLPSKPIIYSIDNNDNNDIINSRTSKSFSIVAMSFPEMRLKLLDWEKEKEKE